MVSGRSYFPLWGEEVLRELFKLAISQIPRQSMESEKIPVAGVQSPFCDSVEPIAIRDDPKISAYLRLMYMR